jgi:inosine/xanthosine triphosphate pyrophosphatase family protein
MKFIEKTRKKNKMIKLNTSNLKKQEEFCKFFNLFGKKLDFTQENINEPAKKIDGSIASQEEVVAYKATQVYFESNKILVEDSALYIEDTNECGIFIKFCEISNYIGKNATFIVLLAFCTGEKVKIFRGEIKGRIYKQQKGKYGFGFDEYFYPEGNEVPFSIKKINEQNPRFIAVKNFCIDNVFKEVEMIKTWDGKFQE